MRFMGCRGGGYGKKKSGGLEREFSGHTKFEVGDGSSMTCGVGIRHLRNLFWVCIVLPTQKML
jgi:hypothetical protein